MDHNVFNCIFVLILFKCFTWFCSTTIPVHIPTISATSMRSGSLFPYKYLMKPDILFTNVGETERYTIVYVRSAPNEFKRRNIIRRIVSQLNLEDKVKMELVFVLANTNNPTINSRIWREGHANNDTIITDYLDSYSKLTLKMWSIFHFHLYHLPKSYQPDYIFWTNTDVMINWDNFLNLIQNAPSRNWLAGLLVDPRMSIEQEMPSFGITADVLKELQHIWPNATTPMYLDGGGVFASNDIFHQLAHECERTARMLLENVPLDDMLITGIWRERLNISLHGCAPYCCNYAGCQQYTNVCQRWTHSVFYHPRFKAIKWKFDRTISQCNATELVRMHNAQLVHKYFLDQSTYRFMDAWNGTLFLWNKDTHTFEVI